jgi:hypothetical protein
VVVEEVMGVMLSVVVELNEVVGEIISEVLVEG